MHIYVSDNREMMPEAVNNQLPVDVDNREKFCDTYVFEVEESISSSSTKLSMFG